LIQAQGSMVGLVPGSEARAVPRRSRGSRELSVRPSTAHLRMLEFEVGLSLEQVAYDREHLTNMVLPDDGANAPSSVAMPSTFNKLIKYINCFISTPAAVCTWVGVSGDTVRCLKIAAASAGLHRDLHYGFRRQTL
jgi:hypothetical protein